MDEVGDHQQQAAERVGHLVVLVDEHLLRLAELPALRLPLLRLVGAAVAAELPDLLGELVDPGAGGVALGGDLAQPAVEARRLVELVEHRGIAPAGERGAHRLEVGAQQPDVDHRCGTLPVGGVRLG